MNIFEFIYNNNYDKLFDYIKNNKNINFNIVSKNYVPFIVYLIINDRLDIITYILKNFNIKIDIVDTDKRTLLYYTIKYNRVDITKEIIKYDSDNIGISIIDYKDINGYTSLHYSIIFNNFNIFKILYKNNANINIPDKDNNSVFQLGIQYNRTQIILYLIEEEKDNYNNFISSNGESILQTSLNYSNHIITNFIINYKLLLSKIINNQEYEYGLTALHHCVVMADSNAYKLLDNNADYNIPDFLGNTPHHYALIEDNFKYINEILKDKYEINYNDTNLSGDTILHLYLNNNKINNNTIINDNINHLQNILKLLKKTNINIQNNQGISVLHLLIINDFWKIPEIKNILIDKKLNIYIQTAEEQNCLDLINKKDYDEFINIVIESYYNQIMKNKSKLTIEWEKNCEDCRDKIRKTIIDEKRSIPFIDDIKFNLITTNFKEGCFYTGERIDILFGLTYLANNFKNITTILQHPLIDNTNLEKYYMMIGKNYIIKKDFTNIEIVWSFQKLFFPSYFDSVIEYKKNKHRYIIIPLGIEIEMNSHANIIIIDTKYKRIERFEPNGANYPMNLNYNPSLLDSLLKNKFTNIFDNYKYIEPKQYLPVIGFQKLETLDDKRCAKIGDPNGFCAVWCVWWVEQRVSNPDIEPQILAYKLINQIKIINKSFKNLIRNYSQKIINIRDDILNKYNLTINDWKNNNYNDDDLDKISNDVLKIIGE